METIPKMGVGISSETDATTATTITTSSRQAFENAVHQPKGYNEQKNILNETIYRKPINYAKPQ